MPTSQHILLEELPPPPRGANALARALIAGLIMIAAIAGVAIIAALIHFARV